jgi:hypothetical protein
MNLLSRNYIFTKVIPDIWCLLKIFIGFERVNYLLEQSNKGDELAQSLLKSTKVKYKGDTSKHPSNLFKW